MKRNVFQCRPKAEVVMKVVKTQKQKAVQCSHHPTTPYPTTPPVNSSILGPRQMLMWHPTFGRVGGECRLRAENVDYVYGWILNGVAIHMQIKLTLVGPLFITLLLYSFTAKFFL